MTKDRASNGDQPAATPDPTGAESGATAPGPAGIGRPPEAPSRSAPLDRQVLHVCDSIGSLIEWWGFKAVHGRIWTLLAISREPMNQTEVAEFLGVSRSLVSTSISELAQLQLVHATAEHRNAPYVASLDIWPVVGEVLRNREWMMLESTRVALEGAITQAESDGTGRPKRGARREDAGEGSRFDPDQMHVLLNMTETAQTLLRAMLSLRVPRAGGGMLTWLAKATRFLSRLRGPKPRGTSEGLPAWMMESPASRRPGPDSDNQPPTTPDDPAPQ